MAGVGRRLKGRPYWLREIALLEWGEKKILVRRKVLRNLILETRRCFRDSQTAIVTFGADLIQKDWLSKLSSSDAELT